MDKDMALLRTSEQDWDMWRLFVKGHSAREISNHYGCEPAYVTKVLHACRKTFNKEDLDEVRKAHLEELRVASKMMWELADRNGAPVTSGKDGIVVCDPDTGEVVRDFSARISAVGMIVKLQERASKLIGLDAPVKTTVKIEGENIDEDLLELARQLGVTLDGGDGSAVVEAAAERLDEGRG